MAEKKDLTNLLDFSKALDEAGQLPPAPDTRGAILETQSESIDSFESLDDYAKHNPTAEIPAEAEAAAVPDFQFEASPVPTEGVAEGFSGAITGQYNDVPLSESPPEQATLEVTQSPTESEVQPVAAKAHPLEAARAYSEQLAAAKTAVPAQFPFSVMIEGHLKPEEKEKLLDVLSRESFGIREVDLEPQFASDRILIPRVSEYAAVVLVQALRATSAKIKLGPSDSIFLGRESNEGEEATIHSEERFQKSDSELHHSAENLPLTSAPDLPGMPNFVVIDAITASAALKSKVVEMESSPAYQEILEALQRELKYKAFRRGATAVLNFTVSLAPLATPTHYRLMVMGSAVKAQATPV